MRSCRDAADHVIRTFALAAPGVLAQLELDLALQDPGLDGLVSLDGQVLVVVHSAHGVLINCLTEHSSSVSIRENLARLCGKVKLLLVEELDKPDCLGEVIARLGGSTAPELVDQVEGTICPGWVELLRKQPEQFETIRGAHLPEFSRKAD